MFGYRTALHLYWSFIVLVFLDILTVSNWRFNIGTVVDMGRPILPSTTSVSGTN